MKWLIDEHPIKELATGEVLHLKTYTAQGEPGKHVHIQASVHGAELQGNAVIVQLMDFLNTTKLKGSITFIPLANPYATNNKHGTYTYGRYNPVTGHNWNRNYIDIIKESQFDIEAFAKKNKALSWGDLKASFKNTLKVIFETHSKKLIETKTLSENNKLNLLLQSLAAKSDAVLDLHTGPVATRYLYSAQFEQEASHYLKFKHVLVIPNSFDGAMDEACFMPWIHLRDALKKYERDITLDIESFTLEFGSEEIFCMQSAAKDVESIINYLKYKGLLEGVPDQIDSYSCGLEDFKTIYSPYGALVDFHFNPGDRFIKGDTLASFYNLKKIDPNDPINSTKKTIHASEDGIIINRCPSSSVHQGMELFQIMVLPTQRLQKS